MPQIVTNYIELHICRKTDQGDKFLLLKRADDAKIYPGIWQMITGTIESHEHTKDTLIRELEEETGLKPAKIYSIPRINTFYLAISDKICMSPVFLTIVEDENVKISAEHSEFQWAGYELAKDMIHWPNQVDSLDIIKRYLDDRDLFSKLVEV
ncbi:MAG TPA: NUDIX domain-containing protein [Ignavibacteria bacterium]|nr:NUDIX domain-containing protein [Ignavibacteria bacterium]HMR00054.1 NUDIX domain-containing protein [Ignavibacteria bacterium]